jgi:hypothetical protein
MSKTPLATRLDVETSPRPDSRGRVDGDPLCSVFEPSEERGVSGRESRRSRVGGAWEPVAPRKVFGRESGSATSLGRAIWRHCRGVGSSSSRR